MILANSSPFDLFKLMSNVNCFDSFKLMLNIKWCKFCYWVIYDNTESIWLLKKFWEDSKLSKLEIVLPAGNDGGCKKKMKISENHFPQKTVDMALTEISFQS